MKTNGLNGANTQVGGMNMVQTTDAVSKNIQKQIVNAQKQLQELSANKDMSMEEKMKKRQEIQQQIIDLNNQLRQHQIEQRKERQEKAAKSVEKKEPVKKGDKSTGLSQASMKAMISADSAMSQAQVQGSVVTKMEGRAGVLEAEIKIESARGGDVEAKKEELGEIQHKVASLESAQMNTLENANKELKVATRTEQQTDNKDKKADNKDVVAGEKEDNIVAGTEKTEIVGENIEFKTVSMGIAETVEASLRETVAYTHVDVCL